MANLKSSKKDVRRTIKRTAVNRVARSKFRTLLKKAILATTSSDAKTAQLAVVSFESFGSKIARKGLYRKEKISRIVSRLNKRITVASSANKIPQ